MKCKNYWILCKGKTRDGWYYCADCLRYINQQEMKKHPRLFKKTFPELFR